MSGGSGVEAESARRTPGPRCGRVLGGGTDGRGPCPAGCDRALDHAIITAPERRDPALLSKLDVVAGRVLTS